jgi:hypothetical protein
MLFGKRSERLEVLVDEQLALELGDLETHATLPVQANDDAPVAKPPGKERKKARRNIGALPKQLPCCEQVLEPEATACRCCQGQLHKIGEDGSEVLDIIPAILRVLRTICPQIWLPQLHRWCGPSEDAAAPDREWHGLDRTREHVVVSTFARSDRQRDPRLSAQRPPRYSNGRQGLAPTCRSATHAPADHHRRGTSYRLRSTHATAAAKFDLMIPALARCACNEDAGVRAAHTAQRQSQGEA